MRIAHVIWTAGVGGMQRSVYQLSRAQARDHAVAIFTTEPDALYARRAREAGVSVEPFAARGAADIVVLPDLVRRLRRYELHHLHSAEPLAAVASVLAGDSVRVFTERGGVHAQLSLEKRLRFALFGLLLRHSFHSVTGNTRWATEVAKHRYGLRPDVLHVTPNGLDFDLLQPKRPRAATRAELRADSNPVIVGTSAYLKEWKRVDLLLHAVAELRRDDVQVLIVGDGPDRRRLEGLARELKLDSRTTITGVVDDVADLVAAMDVFVLTSDALESFGNAAVEAMALAVTTVVMADSPGVCEHIRDGIDGFVADGVQGLVQILSELAEKPSLRAAAGARAAASVRTRYTVERMIGAYAAAYGAGARRAASARHRLLAG